jgi:hypothetical protein
MNSKLELNAGIAKFTLDLSEFATGMKGLIDSAIGINEKEQARSAMKKLVDESRKTFETIVRTLAPLRKLTDEAGFAKEFAGRFSEFTVLYVNQTSLARTHCSIVKEEFDKLQLRRSWMRYLPLAQSSYAKLENVCMRWLFQDRQIVEDMEFFFGNLNTFLAGIAALTASDPKQGFHAFMTEWKNIERDFLAMQTALGELTALSHRLS